MSADTLTQDLVKVELTSLIKLAKNAAVLSLRKQRIHAGQSGEYISRFKGRGMEFDESRPYQAGDDIRTIDWKVTARSDKTHTKVFREERERPVFISVDYRANMQFATRGVFKAVQAAKLAGLLAWTAHKHGDRLGGQIFSDDGCHELKPKGGKQGVLHFLNALASPKYHHDSNQSLEQILARLSQHARPGSVVYLISDFRGLNEQSERYLSKLSRHCEVILVHIFDPLERELPRKGRYRFTDTVRDIFIDTSDSKRIESYQAQFQQQQQHLVDIAARWRMTLLQCSTSDNPVEVLR